MKEGEIINKIVELSEKVGDGNINKSEILQAIDLIKKIPNKNFNVYKGYLTVYYFYKFKELPFINAINKNIIKDERFIKCIALLDGIVSSPPAIGGLFLSILSISDEEIELRDILLGAFYGCLWSFMNNQKNLKIAVDYGIEIIKSVFNLDNFNYLKKIKLNTRNGKILSLAGSGKKKRNFKLLNISSMSAAITAAVGKEIKENIIVEKIVSRATSSTTGSSDIFESMGVNLDIPIHKMAKISLKTNLGVFDINNIVPRLNHIYDGRLYNVQVFAGLVGGAAMVCPIEVDLIN